MKYYRVLKDNESVSAAMSSDDAFAAMTANAIEEVRKLISRGYCVKVDCCASDDCEERGFGRGWDCIRITGDYGEDILFEIADVADDNEKHLFQFTLEDISGERYFMNFAAFSMADAIKKLYKEVHTLKIINCTYN